jgi:hypothetical protein
MFFQTIFELGKDLTCWIIFLFNHDLTISNDSDDGNFLKNDSFIKIKKKKKSVQLMVYS